MTRRSWRSLTESALTFISGSSSRPALCRISPARTESSFQLMTVFPPRYPGKKRFSATVDSSMTWGSWVTIEM